MSLAAKKITITVILASLTTSAALLNRIVAREGDDVTLPFEHMGRCNRPMRLCHIPLSENGTAHVDVKACWTRRCSVITFCKQGSSFEVSEDYTDRIGIKTDGPESLNSEIIFNISASDAGMYQFCPSWKNDAEVAMLVIQDEPTYPYIDIPDLPILDTVFTLTCMTNSTSMPANHGLKMNYLWLKNMETVENTSDVTRIGPHLTISKLGLEHDTMTVSCRVREEGGEWTEDSPTSTISVQYGPQQVDMVVTEEDNGRIKLTCSADCRPACRLVIESNGYDVISMQSTTSIVLDKAPGIGTVFACTAKNIHSTISKTFVFYRHQYAPNITDLTANQEHRTSITVKANETLRLTCTVTGRPEPVVTWYYSAENVNQSRELLKTSTFNPAHIANVAVDVKHRYNSVYTVPNADCKQTGTYYCRADNGLESNFQEKYLKVTVQCIPKVVKYPSTSVRIGQPLQLEVEVISPTRPSVICSRVENIDSGRTPCIPSITVTSDRFRPITYHATLHKDVVEAGDLGLYIIGITNDEGTLEEEFFLNVEDMEDKEDRFVYVAVSGAIVGVVSLVCTIMVVVMYARRRRNNQKHAHDDSCDDDINTTFGSIGSMATQNTTLTYNLSQGDSRSYCSSSIDISQSPSIVRLMRNKDSSIA